MKNTYFVNYINAVATLNTYRSPNAEVTTLEDIQDAIIHNRNENLTATVTQEFDYDEDFKIASFSGINYNSDKGFDICVNEEAHNIQTIEDGLSIWGLDEDLRVDIA